jgi:hypothetical protein
LQEKGSLKALKPKLPEKPGVHYTFCLFHHYLAWISFGVPKAEQH